MTSDPELDDSLWDPAREPRTDAGREAKRLGEELRSLGHAPDPRRRAELLAAFDVERAARPSSPRARTPRPLVVLAGLAAAVLAVFIVRAALLDERGAETSYVVEGSATAARLRPGMSLEALDESPTVRVASLGEVVLEPGAELVVKEIRDDSHRLELLKGTIRARIVAQPRVFRVDTPLGDAIDLGCAYELTVDEERSVLTVTAGEVAFLFDGSEVWVPAGATCTSARGSGPSSPRFADTTPEVLELVRALDSDPREPDPAALTALAALSLERREDALPLFHLLLRGGPELRTVVGKLLSGTFPLPGATSLEGVLADGAHGEAARAAWFEASKRWFLGQGPKGRRAR